MITRDFASQVGGYMGALCTRFILSHRIAERKQSNSIEPDFKSSSYLSLGLRQDVAWAAGCGKALTAQSRP